MLADCRENQGLEDLTIAVGFILPVYLLLFSDRLGMSAFACIKYDAYLGIYIFLP